jgi:C4-dicarboxylate transporter DctQ subunit
MMSRLERLDEAIDRVETAIVVLFISAMLVIAFLQIFLRNVFTTGLTWGDLILRNLVLWIGFIGATLATREGKHINIDAAAGQGHG